MNSLLKEPPAEVDELARRVIGCAIEVHHALGPGFLESVYEEALCEELRLSGILHQQQVAIAVNYKGKKVEEGIIDLSVGTKVLRCKDVARVAYSRLVAVRRPRVNNSRHTSLFLPGCLKNGVKRVIHF